MMNCHPSPLDSTECAQGEKAQRSENRCSRPPTTESLLGRGSRRAPTPAGSTCMTPTLTASSRSQCPSGGLATTFVRRDGSRGLNKVGFGPAWPGGRSASPLTPLLSLKRSERCARDGPSVIEGLALTKGVGQNLVNPFLGEEISTEGGRLYQGLRLLVVVRPHEEEQMASPLSLNAGSEGIPLPGNRKLTQKLRKRKVVVLYLGGLTSN